MSYKEKYEANLAAYQQMYEEFLKAYSSERYKQILQTRAFEFLSAKQLCETLKLFSELTKHESSPQPMMAFKTADEAISFYREMIFFNRDPKKIEALLEDASFVEEIGYIAEDINTFVKESPYLGSALLISVNTPLIELAKYCLENVPQYAKLKTRAFRYNFIESAIANLSEKDLKTLCMSKVITADDLDHINLALNIPGYDDKLTYICGLLGHPEPAIATFDIKLKGVTFLNDDGSSRQDALKDLSDYITTHPQEKVVLNAIPYTYTPDIGDPEPAVKILWNDKIIGNLPKDVAKDLTERYTNAVLTATLDKINGGKDGMSFGCNIKLKVKASKIQELKPPEVSQEEIER